MNDSRHHILIVRSAGIGDVAMAVHSIAVLRDTYPELKITVATKPRMIPLFNGIPDILFLDVSDFGGIVRYARDKEVDLLADLRNEPRGKLLRFILRIKGVKTARYRQRRLERRPLLRRHCKRMKVLRNNVLRFNDVFHKLGYPIPAPPFRQKIPMPLPEHFGKKSGHWIGFAPFSSRVKKNYPADKCERLVELLLGDFDKLLVFSGGGEELSFAGHLAQRFPGKVITVFGKTDLGGELAAISNLDVIITMDSVAMHLASLVGTPCISLWGSTHPYMGYSAWAKEESSLKIQLELACRPCCVYGEGKCQYGDIRCLDSIKPEQIMEGIREIKQHFSHYDSF